MLEEMRKSGPSLLLVLRTDMIPLVDMHHRQFPVDMQDHLQAIRQGILFKFDVGNTTLAGLGRARTAAATLLRWLLGEGNWGYGKECKCQQRQQSIAEWFHGALHVRFVYHRNVD